MANWLAILLRINSSAASRFEDSKEAFPLSTASEHHSLLSWARLVRLPAVFTVIAQVAAAFLLIAGSAQPAARFVLIILSAIALYWSGMIINDCWDFEEDVRERPTRPLPSGQVPLRAAKLAAWGLMVAGVLLAALSGLVPADDFGQTLCPALVALAISICVLLYNGPLKQTLLAPLTMGMCRLLCFLLGAAPLVMVQLGNVGNLANGFPPHVVAAAVGMGVYIMGITLISQSETVGGHQVPLAVGTLVMTLGAVGMALAPEFAPAGMLWNALPPKRFPLLIGLIASTIIVRGLRVSLNPEVPAIQSLVRIGILTLIPFAAAFALLAAGPLAALATFALVIPAILTAARIRVT